ncbi:MAG TPA: hypothetical protein VEK33_25890, partial [Terriglobales bacterium]|nr:hypothetical protein [Terriglobales bacterium]
GALFMFFPRASAVWALAFVIRLTLPACGQSVISTHSGIVHFFEGAVYLDEQPLESHPGRFSSVPQGAELRTGDGRAEVLLTPNVFVRMGERTKIRMLANELSNTRVELLAGSVMVDSAEPVSGQSVTLIYKNWSMRFLEEGAYRIDADPPRLWVFQGKAEVSAPSDKGVVSVGHGMELPFAAVLVPDRAIDPPRDALSVWAEGRQQSISADNAIAANIQDPASLEASYSGLGSFTYYPPLGLVPLQSGLFSSYSYLGYQPGFNSLYLPGYTSLPLFFGLGSGGFPAPFRPHPIPVRPIPSTHPLPVQHASQFGVTHAASPIGVHPGGHH